MREKYSITIERQEGILALEEIYKIKCIGNTDSRSMIAVAPSYPITVFNPRNTRVIFIFGFNHFRVTGFELNRFMTNIPMNTIFTESCEDIHLYSFVVTTEYAGESIFERYDSTVENTIG